MFLDGERRVCSVGVWDSSVPGISFNEKGESNYSRLLSSLIDAYPRGQRGKQEWEQILKKIKISGRNRQYDCVVGVSGGTDSSYLLYITKEMGLRPLAVHLDNGWNSEIAVRNIQKLTSSLNIDLETFVINYGEIKELLKAYMKAGLPWIDIPTDLAIKAVLYQVASKEKVKFILRGNDFRSEGTQPREWTYGDGRQLKYVYKKFGGSTKLKTYPDYKLTDLLYYSIIKGIKSVYPYYYFEYKKKDAQKVLKEKFGWEYYGGHHYENNFTRFAITYWLYEKFGIDKRKITLSAQIVSGEITRKEALNILKDNPYDVSQRDNMIEYIIKKLDFTVEEFEKLWKSPNHNYSDYPSNYNLIGHLNPLTGFLVKRIFLHKPQSLFQAEMRKEK